ncbi:MAG: acyl-CoA thioesterase [Nitrospiraceae bacterium]|nr:MAG: acyl-CoA thioesterase [Nitrospiraceae bacterium]
MRKKKTYFKCTEKAPRPVVAELKRRVHFSEVDPLGIVWHGRYPAYFEEGYEELARLCGLSYRDFYEAGLRAPVAGLHIDYFKPLRLAEEFTIRAALIWDEASRLNIEYSLIKDDGTVATSGYTVQVFTDAESGEVCLVSPGLLGKCRERWQAGEFHRKK